MSERSYRSDLGFTVLRHLTILRHVEAAVTRHLTTLRHVEAAVTKLCLDCSEMVLASMVFGV